jgi:hypothetical protein
MERRVVGMVDCSSHMANDTKRNAMACFLNWIVGPGQRQAAVLGYFALPKELVNRGAAAIARIH